METKKLKLSPTISPLYQYIRDYSGDTATSGAGDGGRTRDILLGKQALYH